MSQASPRTELRTFRSLATLRILNVLAVGSSLAGGVGAMLAALSDVMGTEGLALPSACTTLLFGMGWAALLRFRRTIAGTPMRWGWLASVPVAAVNAATACGLLFLDTRDPLATFGTGALIGATWGATVWLPALITTLIMFGAPIAWAQHRAERGLTGEERGEAVIGLASCAIAVLSLLVMGVAISPAHQATEGVPVMMVFAIMGLIAGAFATVFAVRRDAVRRKFVQQVEEGAVQGYRVDTTDQGKVLVRVTSVGAGYRVANFEEHLAELDEEGEARRALRLHV